MKLPLKILLFLGISGISLSLYSWTGDDAARPKQALAEDRSRYQPQIDSAVRQLRNGDLVLRTGSDVTSYIFSQMNLTDKTYSHCGIVLIENGYPFIYHCIGGEDNPDQKLRRDSASFWFSPANNLGFAIGRYELDGTQLTDLTHLVKEWYKKKVRFDMSFDLQSDDRFYCAEFVYKVMNAAVKDPAFITPVRLFGYRYVGIDNLFINGRTTLICQVKYK
jgi:hypothetical protein